MRRFRQVAPLVIFFLAFFLYCAQACLTVGHAQAASVSLSALSHESAPSPCYSHSSSSRQAADNCLDCQELVLLKPAVQTEEMVSLGNAIAPFCLSAQFLSSPLVHTHLHAWQVGTSASSPPRYLTCLALRI
jgi:hypothetical protein